MNGVARTNDTLLTVFIGPENAPINMSPWYSFKIWSKSERTLYIKLTYPEHAHHRYYPKLSKDGKSWNALDSSNFSVETKIFEGENVRSTFTMQVDIAPDTLWVSAQELITLKELVIWIDELNKKPFVSKSVIGQSTEGRPVHLMKIGEGSDRIMILSRQHPPEVTGFLAMQAFVETLCSESKLGEEFRKKYQALVIPMVNPDGVHHGHWRHGYGGIDLNRDWQDFNQPETILVRDFMKKNVGSGGQFVLGIDFHSTQEDVFYTSAAERIGSIPGLVNELIDSIAAGLGDYTPNIQPIRADSPPVSSQDYIFLEFGAESFTYEVGYNTPRDFVRKKGEGTAIQLMELLKNKQQGSLIGVFE
jgi:predicted deacylase